MTNATTPGILLNKDQVLDRIIGPTYNVSVAEKSSLAALIFDY